MGTVQCTHADEGKVASDGLLHDVGNACGQQVIKFSGWWSEKGGG